MDDDGLQLNFESPLDAGSEEQQLAFEKAMLSEETTQKPAASRPNMDPEEDDGMTASVAVGRQLGNLGHAVANDDAPASRSSTDGKDAKAPAPAVAAKKAAAPKIANGTPAKQPPKKKPAAPAPKKEESDDEDEESGGGEGTDEGYLSLLGASETMDTGNKPKAKGKGKAQAKPKAKPKAKEEANKAAPSKKRKRSGGSRKTDTGAMTLALPPGNTPMEPGMKLYKVRSFKLHQQMIFQVGSSDPLFTVRTAAVPTVFPDGNPHKLKKEEKGVLFGTLTDENIGHVWHINGPRMVQREFIYDANRRLVRPASPAKTTQLTTRFAHTGHAPVTHGDIASAQAGNADTKMGPNRQAQEPR